MLRYFSDKNLTMLLEAKFDQRGKCEHPERSKIRAFKGPGHLEDPSRQRNESRPSHPVSANKRPLCYFVSPSKELIRGIKLKQQNKNALTNFIERSEHGHL